MRIYKTREDFDNLDLTNVFPGTICTIIDEAADPTYIFQNGQWNTFLTTIVDNVGDISSVYINGEIAPVPIYLLDDNNNVTGLKGPDGPVFYGQLISNVWMKIPSIFRLRMTGTGTVSIDAKDSLGNITASVASYTVSAATNQIEFPYAGDDAVAIRATITGTCTVEII